MDMDKKVFKKGKKSALNTLQIAVGRSDKENLTRKPVTGKKKEVMKDKSSTDKKKEVIAKTVIIKNNRNNSKTQDSANIQNTAQIISDLTTDNPSNEYWQQLAESRRVALDATLKENVDLHNKITEMEYENKRLKEMFDEAKSLVEVLTGMLEDNTASDDEHQPPTESQDSNSDAESDLDDVSFRSCA